MNNLDDSIATDSIPQEEHYCRICRSGTEDGPLFHPCKCRGSVKYVHEDCLAEWLKASSDSRKEPKCDICGHFYSFEPLISPDAPQHLNTLIIARVLLMNKLKKIWSDFSGLAVAVVLFGLLFPLALLYSIRFDSMLIDNKMPKIDLWRSILAGNLSDLPIDFDLTWPNLWQCIKYSYPTGFKLVVITVVIIAQFMILQELVRKDEGFTNLLNLKIGDPTISDYVDAFIRTLLEHIFEDGLPTDKMTRQDLERLIELHEMTFIAQARNIALVNASDDQLNAEYARAKARAFNQLRAQLPIIESLEPFDERFPNAPIALRESSSQYVVDETIAEQEAQVEEEIQLHDINYNEDDDPDYVQSDNGEHDNSDYNLTLEHTSTEEDDEQDGQADLDNDLTDDDEEEEDEDEEADLFDEDDPGALGFNLRVEVQGGIKIFASLCVALLVSMMFLYAFPSSVGNMIFRDFYRTALAGLDYLLSKESVRDFYGKVENKYLEQGMLYISPVIDELQAVYDDQYPVSLTGRLIPYITSFTSFYITSGIAMYFLERPYRQRLEPLKNKWRHFYYVLFSIWSVLKVNTIFATEIVIFPTFCGALLDIVLSPIFVDNNGSLISWNNLFTTKLFFNFIQNDKFLIAALYWGVGTLYMCLFATYIGMIRTFILRPGVLFFIRSPDDENTRLVHDALVRPFKLQMSRIWMSGGVYALFILLGFGVITFPLRYFTAMLPVKVNLMSTFVWVSLCLGYFKWYRVLVPALRKFARIYWFYAIRKAAQMTRLSSFMLNIERVEERGTVVYRSFLHRLFSFQEQPDYDNPIGEDDVSEFFASNQHCNCCFVPDGNWIKAPDNDNVSRLYLRHLFYPVKRDGSDFEDYKPRSPRDLRIDNLLGEQDEIDTIRSHTVVYRPPHFGWRNVLFIAWLWFFAAMLVIAMLIVANFMGKPVSFVLSNHYNYLPDWLPNVIGLGNFSDHNIDSLFQVSYSSLYFGILLELYLLKVFNKSYGIRGIRGLKKGKALWKGNLHSRGAENQTDPRESFMLQVRAVYESAVVQEVKRRVRNTIVYFVWASTLIWCHKYSITAMNNTNNSASWTAATDLVEIWKTTDFSSFIGLCKQLGNYALVCWKGARLNAMVSQFACGVVMWTTFSTAVLNKYQEVVWLMSKASRVSIGLHVALGLIGLFKDGSFISGVTGETNKIIWIVAQVVMVWYCCFAPLGFFLIDIIEAEEANVRSQYYKIGDRLKNFEE